MNFVPTNLFQIGLLGVALRNLKLWQVHLIETKLDIAPICNAHRIRYGLAEEVVRQVWYTS